MADVKAGLQRDLAGEHEAIRTYGTRERQTKGSVRQTVRHIRREEREHAKKLTGAIRTVTRGR